MADGGLAELCNVPVSTLLPIPEGVSAAAGALAETLAVAVRALRRGRLSIGESVVIVGAGAVGLMALQAALAGGASAVSVLEPLSGRRRLATVLGAEEVYAPEEGLEIGADVVVECSGNARAVETAVGAARKGGRVVLVGIYAHAGPFNFLDLVGTEKEVIGSLSHRSEEHTSELQSRQYLVCRLLL